MNASDAELMEQARAVLAANWIGASTKQPRTTGIVQPPVHATAALLLDLLYRPDN